MVYPALDTAQELAKEGIQVTVVNSRFACQTDKELIAQLSKEMKHIITIEEGVVDGGFGESISAQLSAMEQRPGCKILNLGLPKAFITHGSRSQLLARCGLDKDSLVKSVRNFLR
jgi:1-deoxy-D-xylulose-5-phosphate synthase